jgi:intracellular sulfur oxidation DsrE/DsrF family protein
MVEQNKRQEQTMVRQEQMLQKLGITLDDMAQQNDDHIDRNDILIEKVNTVQTKLNIAVEDRAPQPEQTGKRERFILLKRNDEDYPYYTIRAQHSSALTALRKQRQVYETVDILLDLNCHPNSKTLYVRIKNELKQQGVMFKLCKISIENSEVDEEKLINVMKGVNEEKRNV